MSPQPTLNEYRDDYEYADLERDDGVLEVTLNTDGDELVWGFEPHHELGYLFADIRADTENEVVIITGAGENFIAEEDLANKVPDPQDWMQVIEDAKRLAYNQLEIPAPMIAAVNGDALVHSEIALYCDIVLCAEDAHFQDKPHYNDGLVPGDGVQVIYPMLLGINRGRYFLLTGEKLSAEEAAELGLVAEVMPRDELLPRAHELADTLLERAPMTVRLTREAILKELKERTRDNLVHGLALEGLAAMDDWPAFEE
jgi:enoyl-CoA hydratase/carnithine racemase